MYEAFEKLTQKEKALVAKCVISTMIFIAILPFIPMDILETVAGFLIHASIAMIFGIAIISTLIGLILILTNLFWCGFLGKKIIIFKKGEFSKLNGRDKKTYISFAILTSVTVIAILCIYGFKLY